MSRPRPTRVLVVNADDFGQSRAINRGVAEAHERGIVTSASLMVRWPAAREAVAYAHRHPELSLGLHLDLGEWVYRDDAWVPLYEVLPSDDAASAAAEIARQLATFERLVGRPPTHLDSHQHVHRDEPVRSLLLSEARARGVPLRECDARVRYRGDFYGQTAEGAPLPEAVGLASLLRILAGLPTGVTELGCPPGLGHDPEAPATPYHAEREAEVRSLCDPRVRVALAEGGIMLRSFAELPPGE